MGRSALTLVPSWPLSPLKDGGTWPGSVVPVPSIPCLLFPSPGPGALAAETLPLELLVPAPLASPPLMVGVGLELPSPGGGPPLAAATLDVLELGLVPGGTDEAPVPTAGRLLVGGEGSRASWL